MRLAVLLAVSVVVAILLAGGVALALPSETPDQTPMVDGRVQTVTQVGTNVWLGGQFTQVNQRDGTVVAEVVNVAVFDSQTEEYIDIAPKLGGEGSQVWDMDLYGNDVLIAGKFSGPTSSERNLVLVDGTTGEVIQWYNSPGLKSVLAAPQLGRVYGGGGSLSAFEVGGKKKLWSRATITVDQDLRTHHLQPGYRDLELDADGTTIWAACACDAVDGNPARALIKLDVEGNHDPSWVAKGGIQAYGLSVVLTADKLYLGAGGSDFLAEYPKTDSCGNLTDTEVDPCWQRDTSGSAQAVEVMDGQLVVGGHFWEVADDPFEQCGSRSSDPGTLDPNDVCQTRKGLAAYTFDGVLDPNWDPVFSGKFNLVWALHVDGERLHTAGEFLTVSGIKQHNYARLFDAQPPPSCTIVGTSSAETLTGTSADDVICAEGGHDTIKGLGGNDILKGEGGADKLYGGIGDDTLDGGLGTDTALFTGSLAPIRVSLADGTASGEGSDTFSGVENLIGSNQADTLIGSAANNTLNGAGAADSIVGLEGADNLKGAGGPDTLDSRDGMEGNDTLDGKAGTDTCMTDATEKSILNCEQ